MHGCPKENPVPIAELPQLILHTGQWVKVNTTFNRQEGSSKPNIACSNILNLTRDFTR